MVHQHDVESSRWSNVVWLQSRMLAAKDMPSTISVQSSAGHDWTFLWGMRGDLTLVRSGLKFFPPMDLRHPSMWSLVRTEHHWTSMGSGTHPSDVGCPPPLKFRWSTKHQIYRIHPCIRLTVCPKIEHQKWGCILYMGMGLPYRLVYKTHPKIWSYFLVPRFIRNTVNSYSSKKMHPFFWCTILGQKKCVLYTRLYGTIVSTEPDTRKTKAKLRVRLILGCDLCVYTVNTVDLQHGLGIHNPTVAWLKSGEPWTDLTYCRDACTAQASRSTVPVRHRLHLKASP